MRDNTHRPLAIFALNRDTLAEEQALLDAAGLHDYRECQGSYKGETERSFLSSVRFFEDSKVRDLLREFNQESVLYLDNQRNAWLVFGPDYNLSAGVYLGEFKEVTATHAGKLDAWTRIDSRYFAAI